VTTVTDRAATLSDADDLLEMTAVQLDALFQDSPAGPIPRGRGKGTVIFRPGTAVAKPADRVGGTVVWHGKVFSPESQDLKNLISPFGVKAIRAKVYEADSWLDDRPCVVLDYSQSSKVAGWIRDEIREVSPGLYLGLVWGVGRVFGGRKLILRFALTFPV
jgi:hypothetical protein